MPKFPVTAGTARTECRFHPSRDLLREEGSIERSKIGGGPGGLSI